MADSNTTTYSFTLPEVGASADSWGTKLNANWDKVDDLLDGSIAVNGITVTGGSIDGTPVGATTPSTGEFTTLTTTGNVDVTGTVTADGLTVDGQGTFTTSDNSAQVTLISTDTDALVGPKLNLWRNSGVGSNGDLIGEITFTGEDTVGSTNTFATISTIAEQASNGSEDGSLHIKTLLNGTLANRISVGSASSGGDVKFYEDTGTTAKMVWDASAERLGIGTSPAEALHVYSAASNINALIESGDANAYLAFKDNATTNSASVFLGASGDNMTFHAGGASERMRIDSSGNVGIGTASPSKPLSVVDGTSDGSGGILVQNYLPTIELDDASGGGTSTVIKHDGTNTIIENGNTERMRIDSSGNLLVGTTTKISDGISIGAGRNFSIVNDSTTSYLNMFRQAGSGSSILANGYKYSVTSNRMASSLSGAWAKSAIAAAYGSVIFYTDSVSTDAVGADITPTERARIDSSGNLLVGKTIPLFSSNGSYDGFLIQQNGAFHSQTDSTTCGDFHRRGTDGAVLNFWNDLSLVGSISVSGSSTSYATSSDYRLKENVTTMDNASDRVLALNPCRFNFITDPDTTVDGFLAHEAQEVVPEAVHGTKDGMKTEEYEVSPAVEATYDEDGNELTPAVEAVMGTREVPDYQGIDQSKLVPLLTKALQEALTRIEALENANGNS